MNRFDEWCKLDDMENEEKNSSAKVVTETEATVNGKRERFVTTEEKAQYEVFATGTLPKERIATMIDNDLKAVMSFAHGMLRDPELHDAIVDVYYKRYLALHNNAKENGSVQDKP